MKNSKFIFPLEHETSFVVMPAGCNYMVDPSNDNRHIIFGGFFMSELDLAAATVVNRAVRESEFVDKAVTYKFNVEFSKPCHEGDIVTIKSKIVSLGKKSIVVDQVAYKETREDPGPILVAVSQAVFVTMKCSKYVEHNLRLK